MFYSRIERTLRICVDIGRCADYNGKCSADATCTDRQHLGVKCTCKEGYTGDGFTCTGEN